MSRLGEEGKTQGGKPAPTHPLEHGLPQEVQRWLRMGHLEVTLIQWLRAGAPSLYPRLWPISIPLQLVERLASGRPANVTNGPHSASATTWARITASMPTTPTSCAPGPPHPAEVPLVSLATPGCRCHRPGEAWSPNPSLANPSLPSEPKGPGLWGHTCSPRIS